MITNLLFFYTAGMLASGLMIAAGLESLPDEMRPSKNTMLIYIMLFAFFWVYFVPMAFLERGIRKNEPE